MMSVLKKKKKSPSIAIMDWQGQDSSCQLCSHTNQGFPDQEKLSLMVSSTLWRQNC